MAKPSATPAVSSKRKAILIGLGVLALASIGWAVLGRNHDAGPAVPKDLTVASLKAKATEDPGKVFQTVHQAMENQNLTEEQRHAVFENARAVMEVQMEKRMDEYFNAPAAQKQAILDRQIDEMQARMKEWQKERAERERSGQAGPGGRGPGHDDHGPSAGANRPGGQGGAPGAEQHRGPNREERMMHSESRDPDKSARRMAYFTAMRQRAAQRGMQMPGHGPGGPGGH